MNDITFQLIELKKKTPNLSQSKDYAAIIGHSIENYLANFLQNK